MSGKEEQKVPQPTDKAPHPEKEEKEEAAGEVPLGEDGKPLSKKAQKKAEKEAEKAAKKAANAEKQAKPAEEEDKLKGVAYGDYELIQSGEITKRVWTKVTDINENLVGQEILVRARIHSSRATGKLVFLVLREQYATIQAIAAVGEHMSKQGIKFIGALPKESIVDITAKVQKPEQEIKSCSQKVELAVLKCFVVSRSFHTLPFQLEDASRRLEKGEREDLNEGYDFKPPTGVQEKEHKKEGEAHPEETKGEQKAPIVNLNTRLDNRIIDLRTTANQAIFRISSAVGQLFREFLYQNHFVEIHTPKMLGGTSEGGANVFRVKYFEKDACLAQSPQLFKQMCVMADFDRVFEIGPVFRAEKSFTHRHMCEFTGLDMEMAIKEHYFELLDILGDLFCYIFENLEKRFPKELAAINEQYPFEPFQCPKPAVKLTFAEGVALLHAAGIEQDPLDDLSTVNEKILGRLVKEKYKTDFYMLHRYPVKARPFYTMLCKDDPNYTCSYDFFMRGEEIVSGAQRIHDSALLAKRAEECGIPVNTIQEYVDSFKYGAFPHGGCGVGLERVVMFYCNLGNIRKSSLFPRDPKRLAP